MKPITTLRLDELLANFRDQPETVLSLIDGDPLLKKREHANGLVIANASKSLFTPQLEHQLFAKGIVYLRKPYRLVSLPLVKIYNYGEKALGNQLADELATQSDVRVTMPTKEDGVMAQFFEHGGYVYVTTRSMLEGTDDDVDSDADYLSIIRETARKYYPALLDPQVMKGLTIVCESIHPETRIVTKYGAREDLVVLSIFDLNSLEYWSNAQVHSWAQVHKCTPVPVLADGVSLQEAVAVVGALQGTHVPEGGVICFERGGQVIHRSKVKTMEYILQHKLRYQCTLKAVIAMCFGNGEYNEWEAFSQCLIDQGLTDEETLSFYEEHHASYLQWLRESREIVEGWKSEYARIVEEVGPDADRKTFALAAKDAVKCKKDMALIMLCYTGIDEDKLYLEALRKHDLSNHATAILHELKYGKSINA